MHSQRLARGLRGLAAAICLTPIAAAAASPADQAGPGLADTPVGPTSLTPQDRALAGGRLRLEGTLAPLDSDVVLKAYVQAWAGGPVDASAVLTPNTDDVFPPHPAQPDAARTAAVQRLVQAARAHPDVVVHIKDVALEPYDAGLGGFPIQNRLFMKGVSYYLDNSPFHYAYVDFDGFNPLRCRDAATRARIDGAIEHYAQFSMDIEGHVVSGSGKGIDIAPRRVVLRDAEGAIVLTETSSP